MHQHKDIIRKTRFSNIFEQSHSIIASLWSWDLITDLIFWMWEWIDSTSHILSIKQRISTCLLKIQHCIYASKRKVELNSTKSVFSSNLWCAVTEIAFDRLSLQHIIIMKITICRSKLECTTELSTFCSNRIIFSMIFITVWASELKPAL